MFVLFVFASVSVQVAQESMKIENRKLDLAAVSIVLVGMWGMSALCVFPKAKFSTFSLTFSQTTNLKPSGGRAAQPGITQRYLWCTWLSSVFDLLQGHRMWVDLDGTLSLLPRHS